MRTQSIKQNQEYLDNRPCVWYDRRNQSRRSLTIKETNNVDNSLGFVDFVESEIVVYYNKSDSPCIQNRVINKWMNF